MPTSPLDKWPEKDSRLSVVSGLTLPLGREPLLAVVVRRATTRFAVRYLWSILMSSPNASKFVRLLGRYQFIRFSTESSEHSVVEKGAVCAETRSIKPFF